MDLCTTYDEDEKGQDLLKNALEEAYEAGKNFCPEYVPDERKLWEQIVEALGACT